MLTAPPSTAPPSTAPPSTALPPTAPRRARDRDNFIDVAAAAWLLAASSFGVLVVASGYAAGRLGLPGGGVLYWVGNLLVFLPVAARVLSRRLRGIGEALVLVLGLAVNQYLLKWAYSPDQFRFPDELQHWAATRTLLHTGQLFQANTALPVSVHFPGLEEMGAALASMTGLPVTAAGMLLAGVLHLLLVATLFMLVVRTSGSVRLAALSCVVYATGLHYLFFDSMYGYQTAALPFLLLAVWASRALRQGGWPVLVVGLVAILVTTVSHHVSALVLVATLALLAAAELVLRGSNKARGLAFAAAALLAVAAWFGLVAHEVLGYLAPPVHNMLAALTRLATGGQPAAATTTGGSPLWALAIQAASLLALLALFLVAARRAVRARTRSPWRWFLLLGALAFFGASSVRFLGAQGPELAGRAATFTYLPMSILAAGVLLRLCGPASSPRNRLCGPASSPRARLRGPASSPRARLRGPASSPRHRLRGPASSSRTRLRVAVSASLLLLALLMVAARVGGWPPAWEQLPGRYLVSGYERGVDPLGLAAASWTRSALGTGNRVAADLNGYPLVSTYGGQDPVGEAAALYDDAQWGLSDEMLLQDLAISYVWVDARTTGQVPASGSLFPQDPRAGQRTGALSTSQLSKLDQLSGADRLYDNGAVRIYDMRNA
ncbi:MAG: hypothetical protein V7603_2001 [Micromonosporaceae bacterium]